MNKVYIIMHDNGEMYEDAFQWVERVFNDKSSALAYIFGEGYIVKREVEYCKRNNGYDGFRYGQIYIGNYYRTDEEYDILEEHDYMYIIEHIVQ